MADANGEYVKVYLYLLRHEGGEITVEAVADALNHTEADVRRAFAYWQKAGVFEKEPAARKKEPEGVRGGCKGRGQELRAAAPRKPCGTGDKRFLRMRFGIAVG